MENQENMTAGKEHRNSQELTLKEMEIYEMQIIKYNIYIIIKNN